jgi:hypothetical protein
MSALRDTYDSLTIDFLLEKRAVLLLQGSAAARKAR